MLSLQLTAERRQTARELMQTVARNNNFPVKLITNLKTGMQHKTQPKMMKDENRKWAQFTYYSLKNRKLTNLFQQTNINISFKSTNTIQQCIRPRKQDKSQEHNLSGIYKLISKTCNKSYIGQTTSRNLTQRYREHICYIRNNDPRQLMPNTFSETYMNTARLQTQWPYLNQ